MANVEELEEPGPEEELEKPDPEAVNIGTFLWELRDALGWTQIRLGRAIGRTPGYLSRIEHGHIRAKVPLIRDIAKAYGIPAEKLLREVYPDTPALALALDCAAEQADER